MPEYSESLKKNIYKSTYNSLQKGESFKNTNKRTKREHCLLWVSLSFALKTPKHLNVGNINVGIEERKSLR